MANPLQQSSYPINPLQQSSYIGGTAVAPMPPPRELPTHTERIISLEQSVQQLRDELNALAESHAKQLSELQRRVG